MQLTLITSNPNKARETQRYTTIKLDHEAVEVPEIQSLDSYQVVVAKAEAAYEQLQKPLIVEDTSLILPFMGRLPGTFIKFFLEELKPEGLCRLADADPERRAIASVNYAVHDGTEVRVFVGSMSGSITQHPEGDMSFGWNCIFIPDGETTSWSNMSEQDQELLSIRRQALQKIEAWISTRT